ncbi:MAG: AraC family transcriptional regulator [Bordetella sp. SCN 67-23]|nr:GlxA family transcriptional regulator [Burkholderiales bacterium]ODS73929.1 MAG: AraC family transcriptional regulator [Bordetella sp. SCN 67-23]OJW94345.1 MAG: AraC family transcriptional regulator [Burkholderiales bacterium 67-32]
MTRTIAILALPGVQLLDVSGPLDVFAQANAERGRELYALRVVGYEPGPIRSSSGVRILADAVVGEPVGRLDTLLVAGMPHASSAVLNTPALHWLRTAARAANRYGSVCTGAFVLAAAGLLAGRRVTTHWDAAPRLAQAYPDVTVEADALHVRDGKVRTSAGVTAGLDLALSLVEEDFGRDLAARVASQLVMYFKRPGGQLQFSRKGHAGPVGRSALQEVQRWAAAHPALPLTVEALAEHTGLSPRHFARLFRAEVGVTPAAWVENIRVAAARALLEAGSTSPKQVAARCGFANVDTLRRAFLKHVGVSPSVYRRHQAGSAKG